jgi:hypothetical protein
MERSVIRKKQAYRIGLKGVALTLAIGCGMALGQGQRGGGGGAAAAMDPHDLTGYWELGPGARDVPQAKLVASASKEKLQQMQDEDRISERWCRPLGLPAGMASGRPLSITQGTYEVAITTEANMAPRHLYFRDKHTNPDIWDPSSIGESIAHWDGDTLVVDTVGFHAKNGRMMIPGGGFRTEKTHLVERFKLAKNGQVLSVTSTWTDPSVFAEPQTYEYRYTRINGMYEPRQPVGCDPYDEDRTAFVERRFSPELKKKAEDLGKAQQENSAGYK